MLSEQAWSITHIHFACSLGLIKKNYGERSSIIEIEYPSTLRRIAYHTRLFPTKVPQCSVGSKDDSSLSRQVL